MTYKAETIAAIATPPGEGGIGIIRVSGPGAERVLKAVFFPRKNSSRYKSHHLYAGEVRDPDTHSPLDHAMACLMKAPRSYTGEDVVELSCHGGPGVMTRVLDAVVRAGARHAEPGEFTYKAFINGKIDLTQAEAVLDLIQSRTEKSHRQALALISGTLSEEIRRIKRSLTTVLAGIEVSIDFPEEDVGAPGGLELTAGLDTAVKEIKALLDTYEEGKICREGALAVFVGKPNVGKSSLLNALLGEDRAIVTDTPGTTRDYIEEFISIRGYPVRLLDTAGLVSGASSGGGPGPQGKRDKAEEEGERRAREKFAHADLLLLVLDGSEPLQRDDMSILEEARGRRSLLIVNKTDLPSVLDVREVTTHIPGTDPVMVSAKNGVGLEDLRKKIVSGLIEDRGTGKAKDRPGHGAVITRERHRDNIRRALDAVGRAREVIENGVSPELVAVDLQIALEALGEILGETTTEDVLDRIFSEFCVGK